MKHSFRYILAAALLCASAFAFADNPNPPNPCGNHGNNCNPGPGTTLPPVVINNHGGDATAISHATGGNATATGGSVNNSGNSTNNNTNVAVGGQGGQGGEGGNAEQTQSQSSTNTNTATASNSGVSNNTTISSSYKTERNAPGVAIGAVYPTAMCQAGFGIGGSGPGGSGLVNMSFSSKECQLLVLAQHFNMIAMPQDACEVLKATKTYARAVKRNPALQTVCRAATTTSTTIDAPKVADVRITQ